MEYDLWFPSGLVEILCEAVKYPFFTHYWKFYFTFNWNVFEILLTYETRIYSNAEQEVHLHYVPVSPFIYCWFVNGSQQKADGSLQF